MKLAVCSIEDLKSGFGNLFCSVNHEVAKRDFVRLVNDPQSQLYHNPEDFRLMQVGTFDPETGALQAVTPPALVIDAKGVVKDA